MKTRAYSLFAALYAITSTATAAPRVPSVSAGDLSLIQYEIAMWWGYWYQHGDTAAAELQERFNADWENHSGAERYLQPGEDDSAFNDRLERSKALFLCTWKQTHAAGNPTRLPFCDPTQGIAAQLDAAVRKDRRDAQNVAAQRDAAVRKGLQVAQNIAAARRRNFLRRIKSESDRALCVAYNAYHYPEARAELQRRRSISPYEWSLIEKGDVAVGMSELALLCSLGPAKANQTVTATGTTKQYVYSENFFVYVKEGQIVAIQDTE